MELTQWRPVRFSKTQYARREKDGGVKIYTLRESKLARWWKRPQLPVEPVYNDDYWSMRPASIEEEVRYHRMIDNEWRAIYHMRP